MEGLLNKSHFILQTLIRNILLIPRAYVIFPQLTFFHEQELSPFSKQEAIKKTSLSRPAEKQ